MKTEFHTLPSLSRQGSAEKFQIPVTLNLIFLRGEAISDELTFEWKYIYKYQVSQGTAYVCSGYESIIIGEA